MNLGILENEERGVDEQFSGAFPRYSGAISAVTDGPPEDINQMPPMDFTDRDLSTRGVS